MILIGTVEDVATSKKIWAHHVSYFFLCRIFKYFDPNIYLSSV